MGNRPVKNILMILLLQLKMAGHLSNQISAFARIKKEVDDFFLSYCI